MAGAAVGAATAAVAGWSMLTAVAATAILGVALAASTASFGALKRTLAKAPALLHVDGKDDARRLWIEPAKFGKLLLLTAGYERGLGEKDMHAAKTDAYERAVYFKRTGEHVELVARDLSRRAPAGSSLSAALADIAADSTIGKAKIIAEDPVTGAVAVDLKSFALQDFFRIKDEVEAAFDATYSLDAQLSSLTRADAYAGNVEIGARQVYERKSAPEGGEPATRLADARRVTISLRLSFAELPEAGYRPRKADPRLGHFTTVYEDWTDDQAGVPSRVLLNRWRLEKSDPTKASSQVKKPIVYWLDPTVPERYRAAVKRGVLGWNEAFERLGLLGAIEVKDAPAGFDPADARHTVIRWFVDKDANYAIGQTRVDPLTGEIYQATLGISALHPSAALGARFVDLGVGGDEKPAAKPGRAAREAHVHDHKCGHAGALAKQAQMTLAVLEARGGMSEEQKQRFVEDYITDLTLHEIGHTLGLRHNFLAKTWRSQAELSGEAPLASSVMDYLATNVAPPGAKQGAYWNTRLGPYDYWAIEYAYKPLAPEAEADELAKIAARSSEPQNAYATDEDLIGLDPDSRPWYIGNDPLVWARGRIATVRELWKSLENSKSEGSGVANYRAFVQGWRGYLEAARLAASIVGGLGHRRGAGASAPFTPVSGARRRAALALIEEAIFSDAPFDASADLRRRLEPSREGTVDNPWPELSWLPYDELTLWLRQDALARLLDPDLMALLSESVKMAPEGDAPLAPRELIETLTKMIWREVVEPMKRGQKVSSISPARRRLQEAHLNMLILLAYRDAENEVPEVSALARAHLTRLSEKLTEKSERKSWDAATRDHIVQAANKIDSADSRYEP
ncbi:MAG: zinc-dependent metalloprotease [Elusimicrobiota bacterium]|nr:MAG: zinc-dependent metalloprotease [Elusimicrobiota bacterium]